MICFLSYNFYNSISSPAQPRPHPTPPQKCTFEAIALLESLQVVCHGVITIIELPFSDQQSSEVSMLRAGVAGSHPVVQAIASAIDNNAWYRERLHNYSEALPAIIMHQENFAKCLKCCHEFADPTENDKMIEDAASANNACNKL